LLHAHQLTALWHTKNSKKNGGNSFTAVDMSAMLQKCYCYFFNFAVFDVSLRR